MSLSQGSICTKRVHLGLSEVAFIEWVSTHQGSMAFMRGSTVFAKLYTVNQELLILSEAGRDLKTTKTTLLMIRMFLTAEEEPPHEAHQKRSLGDWQHRARL